MRPIHVARLDKTEQIGSLLDRQESTLSEALRAAFDLD